MAITGEVRLSVEFRADGTIGKISVEKALGYRLDDKAIEAVRQIVFLPAVISGTLTTVTRPIEIEFKLR
jgi:TonB family protein